MKSEDDKVKCTLCKRVMKADDFVVHVVTYHNTELMELISDDTIIEMLSERA